MYQVFNFNQVIVMKKVVKLSEILQINFIKLIYTEYKKTSSNDTWKLTNSLSGGSYYQYKLQLNNKEVIVPINNYNKIVIFIENDIYVSESSIDLNTIRFNMENEEKNISEITYNLVNEIKLAYIKTYYTIEDPIKLITLDDAIISYYHGYYNGYHIVMMEGYHSINKGIWIETIGGISIIYNDSNRLLAYKDGSFISLEEAYENKSLSKDDLQKISNLHNNSNKYNVRIIENTNKDNMLLELISYNMFSYLHVFDMKNSKFSTNISLDEYKGNELFKRIINSPCKKSINEQVINKEFVIRLSTDTSLLSYNFCVDLYLGYSTNTTLKELSVVINGINYFVEANENDLNELYNLLLNIVNNYKVRECTLFNELSILNVPEDITQISLMKLESIEPDKYSVKRLSCQMVNSDSQIRIFVEKAKNVNLIDITGNINSPISSNNIYEGYFTINNSNEEFEIKVIKTKDKKTYFILNNHIYELNNDSTSIGLSSIEIYTEILTKENYNELDIKEYVNSKINIMIWIFQ